MKTVANVIVALVALIHIYIVYLEMFLWTTPKGQKAFGITADFAQQSKALAANQGLYNGFLAAGLIWGLIKGDVAGYEIKLFFLACVLVAGLYGAATATKKILYIQALPALLGIAALLLA